jgi:hypothetical protein
MASSLKPQDLVVCLKLHLVSGRPWSYSQLADEVGLSQGGLHQSVERGRSAGLLYVVSEELKVARKRLYDLCAVAVRTIFFPVRGEIGKGMPTALHAEPLKGFREKLAEKLGDRISPDLVPLVWPDPRGTVRGETLEPIHPSAVHAAGNDVQLYELLALIDVVRIGRSKERRSASERLERLIAGKEAVEEEEVTDGQTVRSTIIAAGKI